jgi:hypothetical protein
MTKSVAGLVITSSSQEEYYCTELVNEELHLSSHEDDGADLESLIRNGSQKIFILDTPLTGPQCKNCRLECPGVKNCHALETVFIRGEIQKLLLVDEQECAQNPKKYEEERIASNRLDLMKNFLDKRTTDHLLSKSFKRKLKKGYTPYLSRPIDVWVWFHYFDPWLTVFKSTYDPLGHNSYVQFEKIDYLRRHLTGHPLMESSATLILLELYRADLISKRQLLALTDLDQAALSRLEILRTVGHALGIKISTIQEDKIVRSPKFFQAFLLMLAGCQWMQRKCYQIEDPYLSSAPNFIAPYFLYAS